MPGKKPMNSCQPRKSAAEPWLADVFKHAPDMLVILDHAGIIRNTNVAFQTFCGRSATALQGCKMTTFIPNEKRTQWIRDLAKLTSGEWTSLDSTLINNQGHTCACHINLIANSTYTGKAVSILHLQNTSVYQTVERALLSAQGQWELSFNAIADYMCLLNLTGQILRANQAMTRRFEPLYGNLIGRDYRQILGMADMPANGPARPDAVADAPCVIPEIELDNPHGWFAISSFPLKDEHAVATGVVLIVRDISDQHATAEALKKADVHQQQTSKMEAIGQLANNIAHDFNNMLTAILGYSSLILKMTATDDPRHDNIHEIITAAERAKALTKQLLDFSRKQAIETSNLNLNTIIQNLRAFLEHTLGEKIRLSLRLDPHLPDIKAEVSRLEQVIINMAINARDAMPGDGHLMIETDNRNLDQKFCDAHPGLTPGNYVELEVSDTGAGIPPDIIEHLFEPFFTTKAEGKGTGLGLAITYGVVKQFGGSIVVYSEIGRGTTFKLYFPAAPSTDPATAPAPQPSVLPHGAETILVIDDAASIVSMISQILTGLGYCVISAENGREALRRSDQHDKRIDMVLMDVIMQEPNGHALLQLLRKKRPNLKVLYMSGYANNAAAQIGVLQPGAAFLQKPFSAENLAHNIRKVLDAPTI